ncbi:hypothetical protein NG819_05300 [Pseudarthrobacter sp. Fe7]|nr:hypothetical protein NG819_05300 [Pseudarthrobacter sp. Fe7]
MRRLRFDARVPFRGPNIRSAGESAQRGSVGASKNPTYAGTNAKLQRWRSGTGDGGTQRALLVCFTHPCGGGEDIDTMAADRRTRLSHLRAAVLEVRDGNLVRTEHEDARRQAPKPSSPGTTKGQTLEL